jgi:predicted Zn-dependent protease
MPREIVESSGRRSFEEELNAARKAGNTIERGAEFNRLDGITHCVIDAAKSLYAPAALWNWQTGFINSDQINANQRPSGYLTFYSGLWRSLNLTNDEFALAAAHEVAHALREHGRERVSHETITNLLLGQVKSLDKVSKALLDKALELGYQLPFSREQELEADALGMEIAMRAGFDPRAALMLWKKFEQAGGEVKHEYLSTHPKYGDRLKQAEALLPVLMGTK